MGWKTLGKGILQVHDIVPKFTLQQPTYRPGV